MACERWTLGALLLVLPLLACIDDLPDASRQGTASTESDPVDSRCAWPSEPTVLARDGSGVLLSWEFSSAPWLHRPVVPDDPNYLTFRTAIRDAGSDRRWPVAADRSPPVPTDAAEREVWRREQHNNELVRSGQVGTIRPIHCLEALLFAYQHCRYSQLTHPTEFQAAILRKRVDGETRLRVQFVGGAEMFPPKSLFLNSLDRIERAIADGWELWVALHNHTVTEHKGRPRLGVPVPSTSDVDVSRVIARNLGLRQVLVTNGLYTSEVDSTQLGELQSWPPVGE